ncbi:MAG: efflux RND transporter periplasmic adaptor subunit [Myxococcales bacterium]|nr:efflux RND transporter periplasmic adaptor subunit [Myxococcales bacterium]
MNAERLKRYLPHLAWAAAGLLVGALLFGGGAAESPHAEHTASQPADGEVWTCSMHPQIRQSHPGKCPICGMDLIPVGRSAEHDPNLAHLSPRASALARLRTSAVQRREDSAEDLRLLGRVEPNEATLRTVTAWTGGRIDHLQVNVTGERVRAGQVVATLYSPEVFAAHQDLLAAKRQTERLAEGTDSARQAANAALEAARERLRLLGVPDDALAQLEGEARPTRAVPIRTPFSGTVMERLATEGAYVTTGAPLYRVADLGSLWIQLDAYESDLPRLQVGLTVRVEVEAFPGESFQGKVTFIDPTLDQWRRTARVRVEVDNRDRRLRPGMFAQAVVSARDPQAGGEAPLAIPATAPLFTGRRAIVYVEVPGQDGTYEPRTVRLGPLAGSWYPVVAGLAEGERVVTRGAFAVDADLQIHGGPSMMTAPDDTEPGAFDEAISVPRAQLKKLGPVVMAYLAVQRGLAADDLAQAQAGAARLSEAVASTQDALQGKEAKAAWAELGKDLDQHARHVAQANSIEHARAGFERLSGAVARLLGRLGNPLEQPLVEAHCPMAFGSRGASWLQEGETIDNAYFGASMRTCGEVQHRIEPGAHLPVTAAP